MKTFSLSFLILLLLVAGLLVVLLTACSTATSNNSKTNKMTAADILGNPNYQAISYGGYRTQTRDKQPTLDELKEDMKILAAMDIKVLRTYNVHLAHAKNLLQAIDELRQEDPDFEMYVMLGAWIDCKNAWTELPPDHSLEEEIKNQKEVDEAVRLANKYPEIVKIIAVGNEAMVKWAATYYVQPSVILKYVNQLQELKSNGQLPKDIWITSSDNFASWGGGDTIYHVPALNDLIHAVDYLSIHTYPMHDTHYNPAFWGVTAEDTTKSKEEQIQAAMRRCIQYAQSQYEAVKKYMHSQGADKPIHIGETGWASYSTEMYGDDGTLACDQYKQALYYHMMREWTNRDSISCFYFEAFDEPWKDAQNPGGSENHFGLFNVNGEAKYALWDLVDAGTFEGLSRGGHPIIKSFHGKEDSLMQYVKIPNQKPTLTMAK